MRALAPRPAPQVNPLTYPRTFWTAAAITGAFIGVRALLAARLSANGQPCGLGCSLAAAGSDGIGAAVIGGVTAGGGAVARSPQVTDAGLGILAAGGVAAVVGWGSLFVDALVHPSSAP